MPSVAVITDAVLSWFVFWFVIQNLVNDLSSKLSANFKKLVLAMMMTPAEYDAEQLNKAIKVSAMRIIIYQ